ncbi:ThiF family adenylyltransferase [Stenotrophomonas sp. JC08]|uniref:ThiF family adenylyltransferase n=1 Tax=Stenotrophomonas sp. JC08 TaxID=3445779 RepID=UPI003FA25679
MSVNEISPEYIHSRNLTFPSLAGRRVVLIGCGSIGSYLAQALVRLGAGSGDGELQLIDHDHLSPGNLGRHVLGIESLYQAKSAALAALLTSQFPHAKITSSVRRAKLPKDFNGANLVIDATGEESLSEAINYHRLELPETTRPHAQHVWVTGKGECAQVLWADGAKHACYRCMVLNDGKRTPRYDLGLPPDSEVVQGCQTFTPYAVSAPMMASALAIDQISAWLRGTPSPRFRTRTVEGSSARKLKNQDIEPLKDCPACRTI